MTKEAYGEMSTMEKEPSFWDDIAMLFSTGTEYENMAVEEFEYERKYFDHKIELFLDRHLTDYVHDFGILDEVALEIRNETVMDLEDRSKEIVGFMRTISEDVDDLEEDVKVLEGAVKSKKK